MSEEKNEHSKWRSIRILLIDFLIAALPWGFTKQILKEEGVILGGFLSLGLLAVFMYLADKIRRKIKSRWYD